MKLFFHKVIMQVSRFGRSLSRNPVLVSLCKTGMPLPDGDITHQKGSRSTGRVVNNNDMSRRKHMSKTSGDAELNAGGALSLDEELSAGGICSGGDDRPPNLKDSVRIPCDPVATGLRHEVVRRPGFKAQCTPGGTYDL